MPAGTPISAQRRWATVALFAGLTALAAALLAGLIAPPVAEAATKRVYKSPGYKGTKKVPRTRAPAPPRPLVLGNGSRAQLIVDEAGTAHVAWNERRSPNPDTLRSCRLRRGGRGCEASPALVPAQPYDGGNAARFNVENGGPRVLSIGDQLLLLTHRYPNLVPLPGGGFEDRNLYLFASNDGGSTFGPPARVGNGSLHGVPTVFGPDGAQRIGLISDTQTGGTFVQAIAPGRYEGAEANLGPDGLQSSLAPLEGTVAAAFGSLDGGLHVRVWSGQGNPNDAATWGPRFSFAGEHGRLAGGPAGTFLINRTPPLTRRELVVRRVTRTGLGAPSTIPGTANANIPDLFQDASGRLLATYVQGAGTSVRLLLRTSTDGRRWSAPQVLRSVPMTTGIWRTDVAAAADGGGFALVWQTTTGADGPILAIPFGRQGPTGRPGLGSLAGGSADPSIVETCERISFGPVRALAQEGCLLSAAGRRGVKVSEGVLRLNGLEIVPEGRTRILLDARKRTIDTTGVVRVQLRAPGIDPIVLFRGELHLRLGSEQAAAAGAGDGARAAAAGSCGGPRLAAFGAGGAIVKGFPISGTIDVRLQGDGVCIPIALKLPKAFGGITGDATLRADNARGLVLDSLRIAVGQAFVGPVLLEDLLIAYARAGETWNGKATLGLPPQPGGAKLGAEVRFQNGAFRNGSLALTFPFPGIALDPFAASYLRRVSGGFGIDPVTLSAGVSLGVIPLAPPLYAFEIDGRLTVVFGDPVTFTFDGSGKMLSFPVARQRLVVSSDGFVRASGSVGIDLTAVSVNGSLDAFVDARSRSFGGEVAGRVCIVGVCPAGGQAVLSSKGMGGCVEQIVEYGFGYRWGAPITSVDVMFGSCDLGPYRVAPPPGAPASAGDGPQARAAADLVRTVTVAPRARLLSLELAGAGGPPRVSLVTPTGERITPSSDLAAAGARAYAHSSGPLATTWVAVPRPAAGQWRVEVDAGAPAIRELAQATPLPAPQASGRVRRGPGRVRLLQYRASRGNGLQTTFVERWAGGERRIGQARAASGTLRFSPAPGRSGKRSIVALVERDGMPRLQRTVASYVAPKPARPARVRGLSVRHRSGKLLVRWRAVKGARTYAVRLQLADGRRVLRVVGARTRRVTIPRVGRRERATVRVTARDASGRSGPAATRRG